MYVHPCLSPSDNRSDAVTTLTPLLLPRQLGWLLPRGATVVEAIVTAYDTIWHGALSAARASWRGEAATRPFPGLARRLPNPLRWFYAHPDPGGEMRNVRQAVTHGDLHGDNLFVNHAHAWPIDFERTGDGPILRDFVELIQDITTRIARFGDDDMPVIYALAVAVCAPHAPGEPPQPPAAIMTHPEATKSSMSSANFCAWRTSIPNIRIARNCSGHYCLTTCLSPAASSARPRAGYAQSYGRV
ncbi:MAG: phosphotransferase [Blastochloris sp.]|nr:phosphotransferase [Blastochloris sp.]